jgi:hypothetical protein
LGFGGHSAPFTRIDRAAFNPYDSIGRTAPLGCGSRARKRNKARRRGCFFESKQENATTWLVPKLVSEVKACADKKANDVIREQA